jgi:hypothetical protein
MAESNFIDQTTLPNIPNLVLSPHVYVNSYPNDTLDNIQDRLQEFEYTARAWNVPVMVGEYTTLIDSGWSNADKAVWIAKLCQAMTI